MKKLSIIVPIYNAEKTLNKCIDSIITQEYRDLEIILVDDGSRDNSLEICNEYAQRDGRITVHHKENAGLVAARKTGVELASGEYIGFVDSDDFIDTDMYSKLMEQAQEHESDIVVGGLVLDYSDHTVKKCNAIPAGYYGESDMRSEIVPRMLTYSGFLEFGIIPGVVVKVFKKEILEKALPKVPDNINIGEDVSITAHAFGAASSVSIIPSASYHYVQYEGSMIHKFNPKRFDYIRNLYNCLVTAESEDYKKQIPLYMSWMIFGVIAECVKKSGYTKKEIKKYLLNVLNDDITKESLKNADTSRISNKDKIKIFLMRYKLVGALYFILGGSSGEENKH